MLIFERGPLELGEATLRYALLPMLLFFRSFRPPHFDRQPGGQVYPASQPPRGGESL